MKLFGIADNVRNFLEKSMEQWIGPKIKIKWKKQITAINAWAVAVFRYGAGVLQ